MFTAHIAAVALKGQTRIYSLLLYKLLSPHHLY